MSHVLSLFSQNGCQDLVICRFYQTPKSGRGDGVRRPLLGGSSGKFGKNRCIT
ncbi:hypothetical protein [Bacteriovorax stolpii]|uniref:hypothetical protein n=1 Tax=Bacteriovorax stolpii TaxID=960 RepID=UPI00163C9770|nr:hypothetical protein [Bacteriovorax stolpii]BDT27171.1 hypothetical protein BHI3_06370 [Bacteriovorax sp. HI3]